MEIQSVKSKLKRHPLTKHLFNNRGVVGTAIAVGTALGVAGGGLAAGLTGAAVLGGAAYGLTSLLTGGMGKQPSPQLPSVVSTPIPTATETVKAAEQESAAERKKILARRSQTILTGPAGVFEESNTAKKTLLGG